MTEAMKQAVIGWRKLGYGAAFGMLPIWTFLMWGKPTGFMTVPGTMGMILDPAVAKFGIGMIFATTVVVIGGNVIEHLAPGINAKLGVKE